MVCAYIDGYAAAVAEGGNAYGEDGSLGAEA